MRYIDTLRESDRINEIYFCKYKTSAMTKNGKSYESLILQDKTGTIDGKIWDPNSGGIEDFDSMDYIEVQGDVIVFNGSMQMNIKRVRKCSEGEYNEKDYLPTSSRDIDEMYEELLTYINKIENPYVSKLVKMFYVENPTFIKAFKKHSAAKRLHHGFVGGLLEHTLGVVKLCDYFADNYDMLNRDLLLAGALFHDVGKIQEISEFPENDYTDEGQLLGHIVMGVEIIGNAINQIEGFPKPFANELKHLIVAHHGEFDYGSPKKPALMEALALYFADDADAKLQMFKEALNDPKGQNGEWLGFNKIFESNIRKTTNYR